MKGRQKTEAPDRNRDSVFARTTPGLVESQPLHVALKLGQFLARVLKTPGLPRPHQGQNLPHFSPFRKTKGCFKMVLNIRPPSTYTIVCLRHLINQRIKLIECLEIKSQFLVTFTTVISNSSSSSSSFQRFKKF